MRLAPGQLGSKLVRLPLSAETKEKIAATKRGKSRDEDVKARIGATQKGRVFSPEHKAKLKASRKAYTTRVNDYDAILAECRTEAQKRHEAEEAGRKLQMMDDIRVAMRLGMYELAMDIQESDGWAMHRTKFDPRVSEGVTKYTEDEVYGLPKH